MFERLFHATLRGRLLISLAVPLLALLALSVVADYRTALRLANESYDYVLTGTAMALASRLEHDADDAPIEVDLPPAADAILRTDQEDTILYAVIDRNGRLVVGDRDLARLPLAPATSPPTLSDAWVGGSPVRVVSYAYSSDTLQATVMVAETTRKRDRAANKILSAIIWPNLVLIGATLLLVLAVVRFSLQPLDTLGAQIAARTPSDLSPIPDGDVPGEARPLVSALNRLLGNLDAAGHAQQLFLSNAAHQLRTPLAGLLTQLELAARALPAEARPRLERLQAATQRLAHSTHQMLALARSSRDALSAEESTRRPVELGSLFEDGASDFIDAALARRIDLGFEAAPARVNGSDWMLRELLANLLDNAIKYTPAGGHVTARCGTDDTGAAWLEVEDDGPGIPEAERQRVFERFYRLGDSGVEGTGLGLAIVREVAERHDAVISLDAGAEGCGTRIRIIFRAPH
jgi:two-component system sensor histidine kinase TctE